MDIARPAAGRERTVQRTIRLVLGLIAAEILGEDDLPVDGVGQRRSEKLVVLDFLRNGYDHRQPLCQRFVEHITRLRD